MLQACLNGARLPAEHPSLPISPAQIAADVVAVRRAGADMVHVHPKDAAGRDTFHAPTVAETLSAIRSASPETPVGITTGAWAAPAVDDRLAAVASWTTLPDFASVNWHEDGAELVANALLDRGIGVEAGLWAEESVRAWLDSPVRGRCMRVLLELADDADQNRILRLASRMVAVVRAATSTVPVLLHAEGHSTWLVLRHANALGVDTRVGLEDTLTLPDGTPAADNASLVRAALGPT